MDARRQETKISLLGGSCCGCGACAARCPKSCISMEPDSEGFLHPSVDASACVDCGACDAVCPVLNVPGEDGLRSALWAKANDGRLLDRSSSGGVFGLLARDALSLGGVVAGAAWADGCRELRHVIVEDGSGLDAVMRSKYVQSSVGRDVYEGVRRVLRSGRPALFCGTACQVAGMRSYLGGLADSDLFLGADVICHGVPSPELWRRWLGHVESREGGAVRGVNFRSKATGWQSYSVVYGHCATEKDEPVRVCSMPFGDDWYMRAFLRNASLRSSCLGCPFKRRCGSDVTLGDFWGVSRQHPDVPVEGGVSAVLENTGRGAEAVGRIAPALSSGPSSLEKVVAGNPSLVHPVLPYPEREAFLQAVSAGTSIPDMMRRWGFEPTMKQKLIAAARGIVKKWIGRS